MHFKFNVNLTDEDYLNFNSFTMLNTPQGKLSVKNLRVMIALIFFLIGVFVLITRDYSPNVQVLFFVLISAWFILLQLLLKKMLKRSWKRQLIKMKKAGKSVYTPESEICFYDDVFVETTPCEKNELKYSVIEDVSVVGENAIYIYVSALKAYILPFSCFESKEQWDDFATFIKTKCDKVTII